MSLDAILSHPESVAFRTAILGEPDDPVHPRAFADWLLEHGVGPQRLAGVYASPNFDATVVYGLPLVEMLAGAGRREEAGRARPWARAALPEGVAHALLAETGGHYPGAFYRPEDVAHNLRFMLAEPTYVGNMLDALAANEPMALFDADLHRLCRRARREVLRPLHKPLPEPDEPPAELAERVGQGTWRWVDLGAEGPACQCVYIDCRACARSDRARQWTLPPESDIMTALPHRLMMNQTRWRLLLSNNSGTLAREVYHGRCHVCGTHHWSHGRRVFLSPASA